MRKQFVRTENYATFANAVQEVERRGAAEAGMMLVTGLPGLGKSHIVSSWAGQAGAVFLRANVDWTPRYFLVELAKKIKVESTGPAHAIFAAILRWLEERKCPLVIDEAEFTLHNGAATLEKVRDLSDRSETTVVLIGMERIQERIGKHQQISGRIARVVEFKPASREDVHLACDTWSEVLLAPALKDEVHRISGGRMREVLNIIASIEMIAKRNGLDDVDVAHLEGEELSYDWQIRAPKMVQSAKPGQRRREHAARGR